jgi:hypothetical protein
MGEEFHMDEHSATQSANRAGSECPSFDEHLTLTQAAKLAPGRPTPNCIWRWCREGVKAASGERVRLKHMRFGSRIFTTRRWLNEFGRALAEADAAYFDRTQQLAARQRARPLASKRRKRECRSVGTSGAQRRHDQAVQELEEAGL